MSDLKEVLAKKGVTEKEWDAAGAYIYESSITRQGVASNVAPTWYLRELLREQHDVYGKPSEILLAIRKAYPDTFVHVSRDDPKMVAYTPGASQGEADVQVKTTLGRYLAKFFIAVPEKTRMDWAHLHDSEMDPNIEYLTGEAIVDCYRAGTVSSCMASASKTWPMLPAGVHPATVYATEGVKLAVLRDSEGKIIERALVFTDSAGTSKYIRNYGQLLLKKLARNNIARGNFIGAVFNTVLFDKNREIVTEPEVGGVYNVVVPYLDANGGMADRNGSAVALVGGKLLGVSVKSLDRLNGLVDTGAIVASNTSGYVELYNHRADVLFTTCAITGASINLDSDRSYPYVAADGTIGRILPKAVDQSEGLIYLYIPGANGQYERGYAAAGVSTFGHITYGDLPDFPEIRKRAGHVQLSLAKYPDDRAYHPLSATMTVDGEVLLKVDCVRLEVFEGDAITSRYLWKPSKKELKAYVKLWPLSKGQKLYTNAGPHVVVTLNGKTAAKGLNDIVQLTDGRWAFTKYTRRISYMRQIAVILKPNYSVSDAEKEILRETYFEATGFTEEKIKTAGEAWIKAMVSSYLTSAGDSYVYGTYINSVIDYRLKDIVDGAFLQGHPALVKRVRWWAEAQLTPEPAPTPAEAFIVA